MNQRVLVCYGSRALRRPQKLQDDGKEFRRAVDEQTALLIRPVLERAVQHGSEVFTERQRMSGGVKHASSNVQFDDGVIAAGSRKLALFHVALSLTCVV